VCQWLSWITWGVFVVDFVVRLALADERLRYAVRHWYDVLVLALPLLRPLRLLRLIPLLSVLNRRATIKLRGRVGIYVAGGASLLAFCAALAVLDAVRSNPDARPVRQLSAREPQHLRPGRHIGGVRKPIGGRYQCLENARFGECVTGNGCDREFGAGPRQM
jgi:hypothetical protein